MINLPPDLRLQLADARKRERLLHRRLDGEASGPFRRMLRHELRETVDEIMRLERQVGIEAGRSARVR